MNTNIEFEQIDIDFDILKEPKENNNIVEENIKKSYNKRKKSYKFKNSNKNIENITFNNDKVIEKKDTHKNEIAPKNDEIIKNNCNNNKEKSIEQLNNLSEHKTKNENTINKSNSFMSAVYETNKRKEEQNKKEIASKPQEYPYIKVDLMTGAEKQLYFFMKNNLLFMDRITIFPKVRLGDIVNLDKRISNNKSDYYKVACKHVDYLIVDNKTLEIICVIELDDYTHDRPDVVKRDEFLKWTLLAADIPLVRIKTKIEIITKQDLRLAEEYIANHFSPPCHYCGSLMQVKESKKPHNNGHRFYGCIKWPECKATIDID